MRRVAAVSILSLSAWLGLSARAEAQCLATPIGPMAVPLSLPFELRSSHDSTTPVAREVEGPHWALPSCDYRGRKGVRRAV